MSRPRILDLFAGAGLVHDGLVRAGWDVLGVDLAPMPNYPGPFLQHGALTLDMRFYRSFSAIWASPPCLRDTIMKHAQGAKGDGHPDLITPTRALLRKIGLPYVIENVETAPLIDPVILCGSMFALGIDVEGVRYHLERHRKFETNWPFQAPGPCSHQKPVVGVYGGHIRVRAASAGGRGTVDFPGVKDKTELMRRAMGVDRYMTGAETSQGVPPDFSAYVGRQLLDHLCTINEQREAA